jgi:PBP1b-binding outer membrane lipoprotein LpoB
MKRFFLIFISIALLSSCAKEPTFTERVKSTIEEYALKNLDDPKSYEFIELTLLDSITIGDNIEYRKEYFKPTDYAYNMLERMESEVNAKYSLYSKEDVEKAQKDIYRKETIITAIDSLAQTLADSLNNVQAYTYLFKFRSNNKLGALTKTDVYVQITPKLEILTITEDKDELKLNPKEFPGYIELLDRLGM